MTRGGVKEYIEAVRDRYRQADKRGKGRILDEAVQVTGYHRKALIRLLGRKGRVARSRRRGRPQRYGSEAVEALKFLWEATDRLCSKRLHPFLPELVQALRRQGEQRLRVEGEAPVLRMSPSTMDRRLRPYKRTGGQRRFTTTKPENLLKGAIPIRTFADWQEARPGFLEVDPSAPLSNCLACQAY